MLRSNLCDYSDTYIVVNEYITLTKADNRNLLRKKHVFSI